MKSISFRVCVINFIQNIVPLLKVLLATMKKIIFIYHQQSPRFPVDNVSSFCKNFFVKLVLLTNNPNILKKIIVTFLKRYNEWSCALFLLFCLSFIISYCSWCFIQTCIFILNEGILNSGCLLIYTIMLPSLILDDVWLIPTHTWQATNLHESPH